MKIRVIQNFGHAGEVHQPGSIVEVNPDDFGGTYADFLEAGLFEEVLDEPVAEAEVASDDSKAPKRGKKPEAPAEPPAEAQ